jgi:hypothetical protein
MSLDLSQVRAAHAKQVALPDHELQRLASRIEEDYTAALSDHEARMRRFQSYYRRWRDLPDVPALGEEATSNYRVPILEWQVFSKWAKTIDSLFGSDASIMAKPVGPSDHREVHKIERFMQWRVFNSMALVNPFAVFSFRQILFGRTHTYMPWERRTFRVPQKGRKWGEAVAFDGPGFHPLWPDDLLVPAEDAETIQDFSFCLRKFRASPTTLLLGEEKGLYRGVGEHLQKLFDFAEDGDVRDSEDEPVKQEMDEAEGVTREGNLSAAGTLRVWAWYGRWRKLTGKRNVRPENIKYRDRYESELLVYYLPDLHLVIGVQDLAEMYPLTPDRRPIREAALVRDGSYWGKGFGEMLENVELEMSAAHNLGSMAGQFSVGPVIFYTPDSGFDPDTFEYRPFSAVAVDNAKGINFAQGKADLSWPITKQQQMEQDAERLTGQTDQNVGRQPDRPNAPNTATQFIGLIEEGNIRAALDTTVFREDAKQVLKWIWQLEQMYGAPNTFFRVSEAEAKGLFDVREGGSQITAREFNSEMDFQLKLATSFYSRETEKQRKLALYQLDLNNPLVVNSPRALWIATNEIHRALGDENFAERVPEPPDIELSIDPTQEWARMLAGEDIGVRPDDHDDLHLDKHYRQFERERMAADRADEGALELLAAHIQAHQQQKQQKQLQAALVEAFTKRIAENQASGQGLQPPGGPVGLQNLQQTISELMGEADGLPGGERSPTGPVGPGGQ